MNEFLLIPVLTRFLASYLLVRLSTIIHEQGFPRNPVSMVYLTYLYLSTHTCKFWLSTHNDSQLTLMVSMAFNSYCKCAYNSHCEYGFQLTLLQVVWPCNHSVKHDFALHSNLWVFLYTDILLFFQVVSTTPHVKALTWSSAHTSLHTYTHYYLYSWLPCFTLPISTKLNILGVITAIIILYT